MSALDSTQFVLAIRQGTVYFYIASKPTQLPLSLPPVRGNDLVFLETLGSKTPYQKVVAAELLILANRKPTAHFLSVKHVTGKKVTNIKLRRFVWVSRI